VTEEPLAGRRVVVTRAQHQAEAFASKLRARGAEVVYLPTIAIADPPSYKDLDWAIQRLADGLFSWVVFTSANGVEKFFTRLIARGRDCRAFGRTKVGAVGRATASSLLERGIRADLVPTGGTAQALIGAMGHGAGRVLLPRTQGAPDEIMKMLGSQGWTPEGVVAYRTLLGPKDNSETAAVRAGHFDVLTFASPSAARNFVKLVAPPADVGVAPDSAPEKLVAVIGPVTEKEATKLGFRVDVVADEQTDEGLVSALVDRLGTRERA
jgi:uroporphyrinogen III methyltransferase / synthase